jgi:small GTP-binding protein
MAITQPTLQKKICMLGGFSVGKTSLVKRFVESVFSETYLTTVGVKIDKKVVDLGDRAVNLILWDVAGEDDVSTVRMTYLRGCAGYVLVADGTRPSTLEVALSLRERVEADHGRLPFVLLLNKNDLQDQWMIGSAKVDDLQQAGWSVRASSARTGLGVEDAFRELAARVAPLPVAPGGGPAGLPHSIRKAVFLKAFCAARSRLG